MIDKNILIKNLEDFKDTKKYSPKQLAEFLSENHITSNFYKRHVNDFVSYMHKYPRTIIKYSKEHHDYLHYKFTPEENKLICDITERHLVAFWIIHLAKEGLDTLICNGYKLRFAIHTYDRKESIINLIDYVIKFCALPYSEKEKTEIILTTTEQKVLEYIHQGLSVPDIAEKMSCSKTTVENHKKNICQKIDDLELDEYSNKKALAKLHLLAENIFS